MERHHAYDALMGRKAKVIDKAARKKLGENLQKFKKKHKHSVARISRGSGVGVGTVHRALRAGVGLSIDQVAHLAKFYGLSDWQLLVPDLDPDAPPAVTMSVEEHDTLRRIQGRKR
jgi:transcriptional regulator with XRE-family HTH domain